MFLMNEQSKARTWPSTTTLRPMRLKGEQMAALFDEHPASRQKITQSPETK